MIGRTAPTVDLVERDAARRTLAVPSEGMVWAALFMLLAVIAAVGYVVRYRMPRLIRQDFARWIAVAAAPIFAISAAAGGLASPAAILPAGVVLAVAWKRGAREAGIAAFTAVIALAGLDLLLHITPVNTASAFKEFVESVPSGSTGRRKR